MRHSDHELSPQNRTAGALGLHSSHTHKIGIKGQGTDKSNMVLPIEISRLCADKWLHRNRLWCYPQEFTTLQGYMTCRSLLSNSPILELYEESFGQAAIATASCSLLCRGGSFCLQLPIPIRPAWGGQPSPPLNSWRARPVHPRRRSRRSPRPEARTSMPSAGRRPLDQTSLVRCLCHVFRYRLQCLLYDCTDGGGW
jgi:hypothetical protein